MYVLNHTSMADLFLTDNILGPISSVLARYGVILFCPLPMIVTLFMNSVWFFKRGGRGENLEPFFQFLDRNFSFFMTARMHITWFPEGHRNNKPYVLPLKLGMLRYAYERELLVQPVVVFGIENVMSEFTFSIDWNKPALVEYYCWDVIDPKDYKPEANSKISKDKRNVESFHKDFEDKFYYEFERNHEIVCPMNNRVKYLHDGEERELYEKAPLGKKSVSLAEYAKNRRKMKRN